MIKLDRSYSDYTEIDDPNYPNGKAVDCSTDESYDGTPILKELVNDLHGALEAIVNESAGNIDGVSGNPDNINASDFKDAIMDLIETPDSAHAALRGTDAHGATVDATAGQLMTRDANGRSQVAYPATEYDIVNKGSLLNLIYPVGSIIWRGDAQNPGTLFGGTWVQIKDRFLWAKGDDDTLNATGGAKTVTLTTTQMPSHNHGVTDPGHSHTITDPGHKHDLRDMTNKGMFASPYSSTGGSSYYRLAQDSSHNGTQNMLGAYNNTTGITIVSGLTGISVNNTGGGQSHNNMPPYVVKYCWERTA